MNKNACLFSDSLNISDAVADALIEADYYVARFTEGSEDSACESNSPELLVNFVPEIVYKDYLDTSVSEFDDALLKTLKQAYFFTQKVARKMAESEIYGVIVNVFPARSRELYPFDCLGVSVYSAMEQFTRAAALDLSKHGIRVLGIAYDTDQTLHFGASADDIARSVLFLASLPSYTGEILFLDGGASLPVVTENEYVMNPWRK